MITVSVYDKSKYELYYLVQQTIDKYGDDNGCFVHYYKPTLPL